MLNKLFWPVLVLFQICAVLIVFHPDASEWIRDHLKPKSRQILSSVETHFADDGDAYHILKIRQNNQIALEVYKADPTGSLEFLDKAGLQYPHDAFFNFHGEMSNLAVSNLDSMGAFQVFVPSFDKDFVGHLNVYQFDKSTRSLFKQNQ